MSLPAFLIRGRDGTIEGLLEETVPPGFREEYIVACLAPSWGYGERATQTSLGVIVNLGPMHFLQPLVLEHKYVRIVLLLQWGCNVVFRF